MPGIAKLVHGKLLDWLFGKGSPSSPAGVMWVGLSSTAPAVDGQSQTEPSGGSYARVSVAAADWNAATNADPAVTDNLNVITFPKATADWVSAADLTHFTLWDHATNTAEANFVASGLLGTAKPVLTDDTASFAAGDLNVQLDFT